MGGIQSPHGIALEVANKLAFVAGEDNKLALVDLANMQVLATYPMGKDPDVLPSDPGLRLLSISAESGDVTIFQEQGKSLVLYGPFSMPHAHTVCVDPDTLFSSSEYGRPPGAAHHGAYWRAIGGVLTFRGL